MFILDPFCIISKNGEGTDWDLKRLGSGYLGGLVDDGRDQVVVVVVFFLGYCQICMDFYDF